MPSHRSCGISIVKPIAVCASEKVQFLVKGFNLSRPTTRYNLILNTFSFSIGLCFSWLEYLKLINLFLVWFHFPFRLLCALEGKYLVQGNCTDMMVGADSSMDHEEIQSVSFPCIVPNVTGRGFIEVKFFPLMLIFSLSWSNPVLFIVNGI